MREDLNSIDKRFLPAYPIGDAARYLRVPPATLRVWTMGQSYNDGSSWTSPIIQLPKPKRPVLSFVNLIEAHVLRALRTKHSVSMPAVKKSLHELGKHAPKPHPLAFEDFSTYLGDMFVERYGALVNLSRSGQIALREVLASHLTRVERDRSLGPLRFFPFVETDAAADVAKPVVVDPEIVFGRPVIAGTRIPTADVASRVNAGESVTEISEELGQTEETVRKAILYEEAA